MPPTKLAPAVAGYIAAANSQDVDAVAACFVDDALVHDESQDRRGTAAIRAWAEEVSRKYRPTVEVLEASEEGGAVLVVGRVSGQFPGSPVDLRYAFTVNGNKIERLEIS